MSKLITTALYKQKHGQALSRKERKAIKQHEAAPNKREGFCSYKGKRSRVILDFGIDIHNDVLIPTRTMPYEEYRLLTDEEKQELKKPTGRSWLYDLI